MYNKKGSNAEQHLKNTDRFNKLIPLFVPVCLICLHVSDERKFYHCKYLN